MEIKKTARVVFLNTGRGLLLDAEFIKGALEQNGWDVKLAFRRPRKMFEKKLIVWWEGFKAGLPPRYCRLLDRLQMGVGRILRRHVDLQLHLEDISLGYVGAASVNWLIPNQEWVYPHNLRHLPKLDRILCKTGEACTIFEHHHPSVDFLGFSNSKLENHQVPPNSSPERWRRFLHVAGKSSRKGSGPIVEAWRRHPEWPQLELVIDDPAKLGELPANIRLWKDISHTDLDHLRRDCGIALAPSEVEGFGHVLIEAMIYRQLVITTDAPPMNELITLERGELVDCESAGTFRMGRLVRTHPDTIESVIASLLRTSDEKLQAKAERAYEWACVNHHSVKRRLEAFCRQVAEGELTSTEVAAKPVRADEKKPRSQA